MPDLSALTAAILAGGLGTRLRPLVSDRPKVLVEVRGRPFLSYLLEQVAAAGVREVVLCTGHLGNMVQDCFGDSWGGVRLSYSQEPAPRGTGGALRLALDRLGSDAVLVLNGDSFCEANLDDFWSFCQERKAGAALLLTQVADTSRYGRVEFDPEGRVLRFEEKGQAGGPGWINAGIYLIRRNLLQGIPESVPVSLERELFPAWLRRGLVFGFPGGGRFLDIGTPESYREAEAFFVAARAE